MRTSRCRSSSNCGFWIVDCPPRRVNSLWIADWQSGTAWQCESERPLAILSVEHAQLSARSLQAERAETNLNPPKADRQSERRGKHLRHCTREYLLTTPLRGTRRKMGGVPRVARRRKAWRVRGTGGWPIALRWGLDDGLRSNLPKTCSRRRRDQAATVLPRSNHRAPTNKECPMSNRECPMSNN